MYLVADCGYCSGKCFSAPYPSLPMVSIHGKYMYVRFYWLAELQHLGGWHLRLSRLCNALRFSQWLYQPLRHLPHAHLCEWVYWYNTGLDKSPVMSGSPGLVVSLANRQVALKF